MSGLRITDAERITLCVPFTPRVQPWNALLVWQWQIVEIIRLVTDAGIVGYGETLPHYTWGCVPEDALNAVIGRNPAELLSDERLGAGLLMALYDVVGKALEVPVHRLFNLPQVREWCPIAWWNTKMPPKVLADEARDAVAQGYHFHKFKARPWFDVYAQVEAISAVTPPHYRLDIDWNEMLLNVGSATPVLQTLDAHERVAIYEGPIPQRDVEGLRELRRKVCKPIALHYGEPPFPTTIHESMCDGYVIGWGGVPTVLREGLTAAAFHKPVWLQMVGTGLVTALAAHLGAVLPNATWPSITCLNNYSDDLLTERLTIHDGCLKVPTAPGLGVEVDEAALTRYRMSPPYDLPEQRHILTVRWQSGRAVHYTHMETQVWVDFLAGNHPVQERGARLDIWTDDGTPEWADLYRRASERPIREG
jgi:L-alanine-DL-glutamate epimerase-like enolase superfamily enzyme